MLGRSAGPTKALGTVHEISRASPTELKTKGRAHKDLRAGPAMALWLPQSEPRGGRHEGLRVGPTPRVQEGAHKCPEAGPLRVLHLVLQ